MKIALCGFYGKYNFGDDMMMDKLSDMLSNNLHEVIVYSDCEDSLLNIQNGLNNEKLHENDIIVIGGGGIISPSFWAFKNNNLQKWVDEQKQIVFLNINITEDINEDNRKDFVQLLSQLNAIWWVRDKNSQILLSNIGIKSEYLPDILLITDIDCKKVSDNNERTLVVMLNSYICNDLFNNNIKSSLYATLSLKILSEFLDWMTEWNWKIKIIPSQCSKMIDDRICSSYLYGNINKKQHTDIFYNPLTWKEIVNHITQSDLLISMRYHSTIASILCSTPLIDITHHDKNKYTLQQYDLERFSINYFTNFNIENLIKAAQIAENDNMYSTQCQNIKKESIERWNNFKNFWNNLTCSK